MIKFIEAVGKNEEAAIASALARLGLERDDVSVEVLERAKSGFLGLGGTPAKVRVSYEAPDDVPQRRNGTEKKEEPAAAPQTLAEEKPPVEEKAPEPPVSVPQEGEEQPKEAASVAPVEASQVAEGEDMTEGETQAHIEGFLTGLLAQMRVSAVPQVSLREGGRGGYQVYLEGENLGALIGHRGETLDAIQQLTNYAVNRSRAKRVRIYIDVENYRAKREEALKRLAEKVAGKVVKYRRNITLEPMNAYERHVIHEALQDYADVVTYSTGTEPNRRTVVAYNKGKQNY